ncbi:hypothetical protein jhhlp_004425 [Lomentospora prolificans]|uniref:ubiquitinyl hydrolase 1 n=1 Tax=Lomentospora prolificans TaxID=41688 RepID=A0A2N3NBJ4_9PEZI|nr:hypothetical protein jhhlp_004425 [Lomentospora prolificans]
MNSPYSRQRFDSQHDFTRPLPSYYYNYAHLFDRLSPPILVAGIVILFTVLFNLLRTGALTYQLQSLALFFWSCLVSVTPALLISTVDSWVNPPMFPGLPPSPPPKTHAEKSEKMASLLGVNRAAGALRSFSNSLPRPSFPTGVMRGGLFSGVSKDQPPGLGNLDNSCYQNSILQGLASLDHLPPYLATTLRSNVVKRKDVEAAKSLQELIADLNDAENNGKTLWTPRVLKNMSSFVQQDAQEYYSKLLDEIDSEISKSIKATAAAGVEQRFDSVESAKDDSTSQHSDDSGYGSSASISSKISATSKAPRNPLEGLLAQRVACVQCGFSEGLSLIPFNCLTLNLGVNTPGHDLYERLDAYTDLESIEGVECPRCTLLKLQRLLKTLADRFRQTPHSEEHLGRVEARLEAVEVALEEEVFDDETMKEKCKITPESRVNVVKTKQAVIARPPKCLVIHMNRSVFDERTGMLFKNSAAVRFPTTLDLGPWCLGSTKGRGRSAFDKAASPDGNSEGPAHERLVEPGDEERWILDPRVSMVAGENMKSLISGPIYELRAVVTHYGHHNNGHYICYRKYNSTPVAAAPEPAQLKVPEEAVIGASKPAEVESNVNDAAEQNPAHEADEVDENESQPASEPDEKTWWRLSDETVYKVDEQMVMSQGGVFMLFYDCVDPTLVRTDGELESPGEEIEEEEEETLVGSQRSSNVASRAGSVAFEGSIRDGSPADTLVGRGESVEPIKGAADEDGSGIFSKGTNADGFAPVAQIF